MTESLIKCPDPNCGQMVDVAFYPQHIDSGHKLHIITVAGVNPMVTAGRPPSPMLDIPYIGRVRRDGFIAWSMIMLLIGILMGARII